MSGSIKVGGNTIATHTGAQGAGEVTLGTNLRLPASGGIQDSSGNNVLTESGGTITLTADETNVGSNALVVDSSGNVGVGTSVMYENLRVVGSRQNTSVGYDTVVTFASDDAFASNAGAGLSLSGKYNTAGSLTAFAEIAGVKENATDGNYSGALVFKTRTTGTSNITERMRIDSSGNVLMGATIRDYTTVGTAFSPTGYAYITRSSTTPLLLNRLTDNGALIELLKDGTTVGSINVADVGGTKSIAIGTSDTGLQFAPSLDSIFPFNISTNSSRHNAIDLGYSTIRFNDIYLGNAPNVISDRNEKQDIEELTEAEQRVAVACKGLLRKFRWKNAVAKKGDEARIHFGIIAQDLQAAFEAEGLDAGRYGMFMSNTWWETSETYTDDEGVEQTRTNTYDTAEEAPEGAVERTRLGVRYSELLAFIIAAI